LVGAPDEYNTQAVFFLFSCYNKRKE